MILDTTTLPASGRDHVHARLRRPDPGRWLSNDGRTTKPASCSEREGWSEQQRSCGLRTEAIDGCCWLYAGFNASLRTPHDGGPAFQVSRHGYGGAVAGGSRVAIVCGQRRSGARRAAQ